MPPGKQKKTSLLKIPYNATLFKLPTATIWIDELGIVCSTINKVRRTLENQKQIIDLFAQLAVNGNKFCFLIDLTHTMPVRNEIREYLVNEFPKYIKAHAVISAHPIEGSVATTFMELHRPGYMINQFSNEVEAKIWLKTFL